jgi:PPOX class probable F420-dependent enzyme
MRALERRLYRTVRHPDAERVMERPPRPWDPAALRGHHHVLLVTWRRDGRAVPTPVWFALDGDAVVLRSAASDGKVKRVRNDGRAAVAPCDGRGRPLGAPMLGTARLLDGEDARRAERALRDALGGPRRLYDATRGRTLAMAWIAVTG